MNTQRHVATISGQDRPGVIDDVCTVIERSSGRVLDLRSTDLGGQFVMLALYDAADTAQPAIELQLKDLAAVSSLQLAITPAEACNDRSVHFYRLIACGVDHVGVLRKLSHLLRVLSINVEQIDTRGESDTQTTLTLLLGVPRECPQTKLKEFVGQLLSAHEMKWELKTA